MLGIGDFFVRIGADTSDLNRGLSQASRDISGFSRASSSLAHAARVGMLALGTAAIAAGGTIVGAIGKGLAEFKGFEKGMSEVFTLLPKASDQAMGEMTKDVKAFSKEFGVLPEQTIPALYQALSAGVPEDNVFEFLEVAQKAARGGVTELETAVDGISSVINAYGREVISATEASDLMFTAVRLGKTTMDELSASLFQVNPTAAALGIGFDQVTAAMATMTSQGVPTRVAATQLRQMLVDLSKEGQVAAENFERIAGKSFREFVKEGGTVNDALVLMDQYATDNNSSLQDMFGSVEAGQGALALGGQNADAYAEALAEMGAAAGATEEAYSKMADDMQVSLDRLRAAFDVLKINIGEKFAPVFKDTVDWIVDHVPQIESVVGGVFDRVAGVFTFFTDQVLPPVREAASEFFAGFRGDAEGAEGVFGRLGDVAGGFRDYFVEIAKILGDAFGSFVEYLRGDEGQKAIETVFAALGTYVETWHTIMGTVWRAAGELVQKFVEFLNSDAGKGLIESAMTLIGTAAEGVKKVFDKVWPEVEEIVQVFIDWLGGDGMEAISGLFQSIMDLVNGLIPVFTKVFNDIAPIIEAATPFIKAALYLIELAIGVVAQAAQDLLNLLYALGVIERKGPPGASMGLGIYNEEPFKPVLINPDTGKPFIQVKKNEPTMPDVGGLYQGIGMRSSLPQGWFQHGGQVPGTGPVPIWAHGGELVVPAEQTKALLGLFKNAQSFATGGIVNDTGPFSLLQGAGFEFFRALGLTAANRRIGEQLGMTDADYGAMLAAYSPEQLRAAGGNRDKLAMMLSGAHRTMAFRGTQPVTDEPVPTMLVGTSDQYLGRIAENTEDIAETTEETASLMRAMEGRVTTIQVQGEIGLGIGREIVDALAGAGN